MKTTPTVSALVCTIDERIKNIETLMPMLLEADEVIISHQITKPSIKPSTFKHPKIKYVTLDVKGLSINRNNAVQHANGDVCYTVDDDISLAPGWCNTIKQAFDNNNADMLTFIIEGLSYPVQKNSKVSTMQSLRKKSVEIAFKRKSILDVQLKFDENFGLGSRYPSGEENIFLVDALRKQLIIIETPFIIGSHFHPTSGLISLESIAVKPYIWKRMFGRLGVVCSLFYFAYKIIFNKNISKLKGLKNLVKHSFKAFIYGLDSTKT